MLNFWIHVCILDIKKTLNPKTLSTISVGVRSPKVMDGWHSQNNNNKPKDKVV